MFLIALIAVEILFCLDFENLSLTKGEAKKIATESRFPALKKRKAQTNLSFNFISSWPLSF